MLQKLLPGSSWYLPFSHGVQFLASLAVEYEPAPHVPQRDVSNFDALITYWPGMHRTLVLQNVLPGSSWYLPFSHGVQFLASLAVENCPLGQSVHAVATESTYRPGEHGTHNPPKEDEQLSLVAPLLHVPHSLHTLAPTSSWNFPFSHRLHAHSGQSDAASGRPKRPRSHAQPAVLLPARSMAAGHSVQLSALVAPLVSVDVMPRHATQKPSLGEATTALYLPRSHAVQLPAVAVVLYLPAGQDNTRSGGTPGARDTTAGGV